MNELYNHYDLILYRKYFNFLHFWKFLRSIKSSKYRIGDGIFENNFVNCVVIDSVFY
jgi:hypothetical protein